MFITRYCGLFYVNAYSYFSSSAKCKFELKEVFDLVKNRQMKILQQTKTCHLSSHSLYNTLLVCLKVILPVSVRQHILCRGRFKKKSALKVLLYTCCSEYCCWSTFCQRFIFVSNCMPLMTNDACHQLSCKHFKERLDFNRDGGLSRFWLRHLEN